MNIILGLINASDKGIEYYRYPGRSIDPKECEQWSARFTGD